MNVLILACLFEMFIIKLTISVTFIFLHPFHIASRCLKSTRVLNLKLKKKRANMSKKCK